MYKNLEAELARKGLKKMTLAKIMKISPSTLSQKLKGRAAFTLGEAFEIKKILEVDMIVEDLFIKTEAEQAPA